MLEFVLKKLINKKWMTLSLILGNVLLCSISAANPIYTEAVLQRTLQSSFSASMEELEKYPFIVRIEDNCYTRTYDEVLENEARIATLVEEMDIPLASETVFMSLKSAKNVSVSEYDRSSRTKVLTLSAMTDFYDHISLYAGRQMNKEPDEDGIIDVMVATGTMDNCNMILGEVVTFPKITDGNGNPLQCRICGVFTYKEETDPYWVKNPTAYNGNLFMDPELFERLYVKEDTEEVFVKNYYLEFDYTAVSDEDVPRILQVLTENSDFYKKKPQTLFFDNVQGLLEDYQKTAAKVRTTFLIIQVPVFLLLITFIFMVSRQMLDMEQGEIAVLKSRGASGRQIISIYTIQSAIISIASALLAIPIAYFIARVLGAANGFLEFVYRKNFFVRLNKKAFLYEGISVLVSVLFMVIPVFKRCKTTIVQHKQKKNRKKDTPFFLRFYLDFIFLGISLYGFYTFNNQKSLLMERVLQQEALDPLIFLSSSLFMLGAGLFAIRLIPLCTKLIFSLSQKRLGPALYMAFVRITRTKREQSFIMIFLIMTIALGVFNSAVARTIKNNDEENVRYMTGADIVLKEKWENNATDGEESTLTEMVYYEPDFTRYSMIEGVESAARVYISQKGSVSAGAGSPKNVMVMSIDTKEFGNTANFDESLLPKHWYAYLNAMSQNPLAVLVSANFKEKYNYKIGDEITYNADGQEKIQGIIYGFVDYWPGYAQTIYEKGDEGLYVENEQYLIISNLAKTQSVWGVLPYYVFLKTDGNNESVYQYLEEKGIACQYFADTSQKIVAKQNDPARQGTYGILTVEFIVTLLLCMVGFLIYWILSIRQRELQFGIFRAMGMSMKEIIAILITEQTFISGLSILAGFFVGKITSDIFMPLIQIGYVSQDMALPLQIINEPMDMVRIALVVGAILFLGLIVLSKIVRHMKIAQALKLGED